MNILKWSGIFVIHKIVHVHVNDSLRCLGSLPPAVFVIFSIEKFLAVLVHDTIINARAILPIEKRAGIEHKQSGFHGKGRTLRRTPDLIGASCVGEFGSCLVIFTTKPVNYSAPRGSVHL